MHISENETGTRPVFKGEILDANNRTILKDPLLCCQFLKGYTNIPAFKDIEPEDIEDETEKYQAYLGIQFESDTVKKITVKGEGIPYYIISLVEHKSRVYYNITIQLLKYIVCIWDEYGKKMEQQEVSVESVDFKYPPIIPIVYYEGSGGWTASIHLRDRVYMSELFEEYIPDFTYKLVDVHSFSNEELLEHNDEMSLLMSINKVQSLKDFTEFLHSEREKIDIIIKKAPERILQIISSVMWNLCMKINIPTNEAEECVNMIRGRRMGQWFENMEKFDVQEEVRRSEALKLEVEQMRRELKQGQDELEQMRRDISAHIEEAELRGKIKTYYEMGMSVEQIADKLDISYKRVKDTLETQ